MKPETPAASPAVPREAKVPGAGGNSAALDQWRGLALVFVLISHGFYFTNRFGGFGRVGVNLFFFISGVLVFRSLSKPTAEPGLELAKDFWRRRLRRLYPALLGYLLAMIPIVYLFQHRPNVYGPDPVDYLRGLPIALLYLSNYFGHNGPMSLGHLWSLSCEMQFYLLAPLIYLAGGRSASRRNLVWGGLLLLLMTSGVVLAIVDKVGIWKYHFEVAVWPMMLGFTCEYRKDWFRRLPEALSSLVFWGGVVAFAVVSGLMLCGYDMKKPVVAIGTFAFVPCFLAYLRNRPLGGLAGRVLTWLGERTYSIYLWQQPLSICGYLPIHWHPVGSLVAIGVGGVWFRLFEQPFLSSGRKRFVVTGSPP